MGIWTIDDLHRASQREIDAALNSINFKGLIMEQLHDMGQRQTLSEDEYEDARAEALENGSTCPKCFGRGVIYDMPRSVGTIHASAAHYCVARLYHDIVGDLVGESSISPALYFTFGIGHALHEVAQDALLRALGADKFKPEIRVDNMEAMIAGSHTDGLATLELCRAIFEFKTITGNDFPSLRKPKTEHTLQGNIYAASLDCPFVSLVYVSKFWPHEMKEYVTPYDHTVYESWLENTVEPIEVALEAGVPPIATASRYECKDCPYDKTCEQSLNRKRRLRR
jgi:hypothetical protein